MREIVHTGYERGLVLIDFRWPSQEQSSTSAATTVCNGNSRCACNGVTEISSQQGRLEFRVFANTIARDLSASSQTPQYHPRLCFV